MMKYFAFFLFGLLCMTLPGQSAGRVTLVENSTPKAVLVLPPEPAVYETLAAKEIADYLQQISGAKLDTVAAADAAAGRALAIDGVPILIGRSFLAGNQQAALSEKAIDGKLLLDIMPDAVNVAGVGEGTLFAAYELLERLGVRWFMPGRLGTVVPSTKTVALDIGRSVQTPSFPARHFQMGYPEWQRRLRCGGPMFPAAHGLPVHPSLFAEHPEYFALVNGQRRASQVCVSNPEVVKLVTESVRQFFRKNPNERVIGLGPNDGSGFCQCENCRALEGGDYDPFSGELSTTDRYIWIFNQVLDGIKDEFPNKKIGFYIYHTYMRPPVKQKPDPRITGALAPITLCRVHGPNNPLCSEAGYYQWLAGEWGKLIPELWDRGYWSNLACPGLPFILVHRLREQIPFGKQAGITGWRVETFHHWGTELPSMYVAGKLMWNADADVDALLDDFAAQFFGPAQKPMRRYVTLMDEALRDADYHTGCSWDMPNFYPPALRKEARALLVQARKLAGRNNIYAERVQMMTQTLDYLDAFIAMLDGRAKGDLAGAKAALDRANAVIKTLSAYDPPMVDTRLMAYYLGAFFANTTESGGARVTGGNQPLAIFRDEWEFLLDTDRVGEDLGWWRSDLPGGNWQRMKTSSASWSNQGLRYYKGLAWYRQTVKLPESSRGKRVFLWCGGVDEKAKVWVNGKPVGISHSSAFNPFEFDATDAVIPGGENTVVMCVANLTLDELGTGGIVSPVMFYLPADGKDAKPEYLPANPPAFP
jgi:hypothetical protein